MSAQRDGYEAFGARAGSQAGRTLFGGAPGTPGGMRGPATMGMPVEKPKDFKGSLGRLLSYLAPSGPALLFVFVMSIVATGLTVLAPKMLGDITTVLFRAFVAARSPAADPFDFTPVARILGLLAVLYVLSAVLTYFQSWIMSTVSQRLVRDLRRETREKLDRLPLGYFDGRPLGEILSRMTNDIDAISGTLQQTLTQIVSSIATLVGVFVMMLIISPLLTVIALAVMPLSALVTAFVTRRSRTHFSAQQKAFGELTGLTEETFGGFRVVKAFGREREAAATFGKTNDELYRSGMKAQFISGLIMPLMHLVNNLAYVVVCVAGGVLAARGSLPIGDIQAFIQYLRQFSQPIVQTANIANVIQSTIAAAERVFILLDEEEERADVVPAAEAVTNPIDSAVRGGRAMLGEVRFEAVSFRYRKDTPLIEDLNLEVSPGKVAAIVGPTGAGKTTLVNLLLRFYEPDSGRILLDGVDIATLKRGLLRRSFGMVLQDTWLFNGTIRDNIAYGKEGASDEEVFRAAKAARADHFIRTLPDGYATVLNEEASNLSLGQKQLLTIARAVLADPPVLILDEATSSVDTRTELQVQHALVELMANRTSFVIAHRLSTVRDAAAIIVMDGGRIVEQGTHRELLARNGAYAELYGSQFAAPV